MAKKRDHDSLQRWIEIRQPVQRPENSPQLMLPLVHEVRFGDGVILCRDSETGLEIEHSGLPLFLQDLAAQLLRGFEAEALEKTFKYGVLRQIINNYGVKSGTTRFLDRGEVKQIITDFFSKIANANYNGVTAEHLFPHPNDQYVKQWNPVTRARIGDAMLGKFDATWNMLDHSVGEVQASRAEEIEILR